MKVLFYGNLRLVVGEREIQVSEPFSTLGELLRELTERYDEGFRRLLWNGEELSPGIVVLVNGVEPRRLGGLAAPLGSGDVVYLVPPTSGGGNG